MNGFAELRVVDFTRIGPGPVVTMMLGDLGADVIKVEEPGGGRRARDERALRGESPDSYSEQEWRLRSFNPMDRNKRSISVDLRGERGRDVGRRLLREADIVVEGFRPGVMTRLGLDYEAAQSLNPEVIYCSISGFGHRGPRAPATGHDLSYLAYTGALSLIGDRNGRPVVPINVIGDYAAGSFRALATVLTALITRARTGSGQFVDLAMTDGIVELLGIEVARYVSSGAVPEAGNMHLTGGVAYYNVYETSDGRWLAVACNEPHFFRRLCELLGLPEVVDNQLGGPEVQARTYEAFSERFGERSGAEWSELMRAENLPCDLVRTLDEVVGDEHLWARGTFTTLEHPEFGPITQIGPGPGGQAPRPPVPPGADSREVLAELAYADDDIERLVADRVVALPAASIPVAEAAGDLVTHKNSGIANQRK